MSNREHNIKLFKKNKEIKGLKINSLLHTCGQQITLKHKKRRIKNNAKWKRVRDTEETYLGKPENSGLTLREGSERSRN